MQPQLFPCVRLFAFVAAVSCAAAWAGKAPAATVNPCSFPLPLCRGDVEPPGGNGIVDLPDLLAVITTWGQLQNPPGTGPRPQGDCHPLPNGDCTVNLGDLLAVIGQWGNCPIVTGACCIQGACFILTEAECIGPPNLGVFQGSFSSCAGLVCPTPPPNDVCANATLIPIFSNWNNNGANFDGPPVPGFCLNSGTGGRQDIWFKYYSGCANSLIHFFVSAEAPFTDTVIQVFRGWNCNPLGEMIACNDDSTDLHASVTIPGTDSPYMLIRVMSKQPSLISNQGVGSLGVVLFTQDVGGCQGAQGIQIGQVVNSHIQSPSGEHCTLTDCLSVGDLPDYGRWFRVTGNGHTLTASTCGSPPEPGWDAEMMVFCGIDCFDLACIAQSSTFDCGPSGEPGTGSQERVSWCSQAGKTYYVFVGSHKSPPNTPDGAFQLVVSDGLPCIDAIQCGFVPKSNDLCANAQPITNGTRSFSTVFAHTDGNPTPTTICNDSSVQNQTVQDIWYRYTATCTGILQVTTCDELGGHANYDSDIVIYPGTQTCPPAGNSAIGCNDDDMGHPCGQGPGLWMSTARASVTSGQSYIIRVGGWANPTDAGTGILNISCSPAICGNGVVEAGEECDDGNGTSGDGCDNCIATAVCSLSCTYSSFERCAQFPTDSVNGGCNFNPPTFESVPLAAGTAVICGELWAGPTSQGNMRDIDWYTVTVGPSGTIQAHVTGPTAIPLVVQIARADIPGWPSPCMNLIILDGVVTEQGECGLAVATNLPVGSTALVIATTNEFTGYPCSAGPWTYSVRVVSP